jgi:hypothetical protein
VFNVPLLLAIEANTQLKVGIGRKALFLYKKAKNNGMLHLLMSEAATGVGTSIGSMVTTTEGLTRHSEWGDDTWHEAPGVGW